MGKKRYPAIGLFKLPEFLWLWISNHAFRAHPHKRKAFYEHQLAKQSDLLHP
jgi:hypothetical protein